MDSLLTQLFDIVRWVVFTTSPAFERYRRQLIRATPPDLRYIRVIAKVLASWLFVLFLFSAASGGLEASEKFSLELITPFSWELFYGPILMFLPNIFLTGYLFRWIFLHRCHKLLRYSRQLEYTLYAIAYLMLYMLLLIIAWIFLGSAAVVEFFKARTLPVFVAPPMLAGLIVPYLVLSCGTIRIKFGIANYVVYVASYIIVWPIILLIAGRCAQRFGLM